MFRYLILGLLREGTAKHGYALAKQYREQSGVLANTGTFYRELQNLTGLGLVQIAENPPGADPRRTLYVITPTGRTAFDEWLFHPPEIREGWREDEISSRARFLLGHDNGPIEELLVHWERQLWVHGKVIERARDAARANEQRGAGRGFGVLAVLLARRLKCITADVEFIAEFRELASQAETSPAESRLGARSAPVSAPATGETAPRRRSARASR